MAKLTLYSSIVLASMAIRMGDREETASPTTEFGIDIDSCLLFRKGHASQQ